MNPLSADGGRINRKPQISWLVRECADGREMAKITIDGKRLPPLTAREIQFLAVETCALAMLMPAGQQPPPLRA